MITPFLSLRYFISLFLFGVLVQFIPFTHAEAFPPNPCKGYADAAGQSAMTRLRDTTGRCKPSSPVPTSRSTIKP